MTAAGLGDVLAKSVSSVDWRLNQILFGDYYCQLCMDLQRDIEPQCISQSVRIAEGSPEAIAVLFDALVLTGLIMTMVGSSIPASGAEHAISHTLDMMSFVDGKPHDFHGRQVGLGTIVAAALYEEVLSVESPSFSLPDEETDWDFWGPLAGEVEGYHGKKRERAALALEHLAGQPAKWEELRRFLGPMLQDPSSLKETLLRAKAAHTVGDLGMDRERFLAALLHAHEIRERYTVIDLARTVGVLPAKAGEIIDRWVMR